MTNTDLSMEITMGIHINALKSAAGICDFMPAGSDHKACALAIRQEIEKLK